MAPPQQTFSIGRSPECDLVLADSSVSRKHAELILLDAGRLFLVDCQSTRGTRLSQHGYTQQVQQAFVSLDAEVQFGDVSMSVRDIIEALRLKYPNAAAAASAAAPWGQETQFVRCQCGVIRERGQRCPECGA